MAVSEDFSRTASTPRNSRALSSGQASTQQRSYSSNWINRRHSSALLTTEPFSKPSISVLRLADVAKQHGLGIHVENWREDQLPVRQYLPMQHIIGSLKRDWDEKVRYRLGDDSQKCIENRHKRKIESEPLSPEGDDSFSDMLRTSKRRRISAFSSTDSQFTDDSDPDRRFSYQTTEQIAKDIPRAALPGLNMALNLATLTAGERDIFSEYAPKHLEDPQILMSEVLQLREQMMDKRYTEDTDELTDDMTDDEFHSPGMLDHNPPVIPAEREAEVRKAFEDFVDFDGSNRFIARI